MQQLVNWSVYAEDIEPFPDGWAGVARYVAEHGLDGVELLLDLRPPSAEIPPSLVKGVHLPLWTSWLDIWRDVPGAVERYFPQADELFVTWCGGGRNSAEMVDNLITLWNNAAALTPTYMVWHVTHSDPAHAFNHAFSYSDKDVVDALAALLNTAAAAYFDKQPPVKLALENVWWPGLTFVRPEIATRLAAQLNFENWCFVFDTAHLLNCNRALRSEDEAVDFALATVGQLDRQTVERIDVMHLNLSLSGVFHQAALAQGLPERFETLPFSKIFDLTQRMIFEIDQHRPISSPRWQELINDVNPQTVTHELTRGSLDELTAKLTVQQQMLNERKQC